MLTVSDFLLILTELHKNRPMLTNEELEIHSISAWKEEKIKLNRKSDKPIPPSFRSPLIQAGPHESLKDVALRILQNKISTVPIIHSSQDGSCLQLLHLACLPGILKYICRHFRHSPGTLPLLQQPVGSLPLAQISSIPIVDDNGFLLDVYSRSDITSLARSNAYDRIQLDQTNMHQALQLAYEANNAINAHRQWQTCLRSDSLHVVMERLSDPAVRRLIVIEAGSKRLEGIISLRDVFNYILV
ncbi:hypothetical protein HHK36_032754 [Tetracentron sinense]|nr:hypothetical protein HHK36_032754 [Tetracentron sinense]